MNAVKRRPSYAMPCCDLRLILWCALGEAQALRWATVLGSVEWDCPDCGGKCSSVITVRA